MGAAGKLAILAGDGTLPSDIAQAARTAGTPVCAVDFAGVRAAVPDDVEVIAARFERLGALFDDLRTAGVDRVVMAGALARPALDPAALDATTLALAPRIMAALKSGDDGLLRAVIAVFEEAGFAVLGAHELVPGLVAEEGVLGAHAPTPADRADADRADAITAALGALDLGQGAVVAQGLCLGVETVQGTDAMLDWVARTGAACRPDAKGARGVFLKRPKPGQDLRADMPVIGPDTVRRAAGAGLAGIVIAAGGVMILDRAATLAAADAAGLFIWARGGLA
ncbi:DUF1009 domain-containing protein [Maritimibacter sp. 55A14]|uniref:LpxI family protein n=1 Tax=Maritimibacter sp. 55A14 TaxID=2174844 RepID=UPI000D608041|nr:UDP-2,3-diacylglucosamine diphosphatase LpxI [Maritimibacter sp. 55A14]PWE34287.1 DUF1009 domain-containing protein [Maritimibacter sp. 55A14]